MPDSKDKIQAELNNLIKQQEERVIVSSGLDCRIAIIEVVRAIDYFFIGSIVNRNWADKDLISLIQEGVSKSLYLYLDKSTKNLFAPLFQSTKELQMWADSVLQHCGRIGICEWLLNVYKLDLFEIKKTKKDKYYAYPKGDNIGAESFEHKNLGWILDFIDKLDNPSAFVLKADREKIRKEMAKRVNVWRNHFIQYTTTAEIDEFYEAQSVLHLRKRIGQDSFPKEFKFGGQEFVLYCIAVIIITGWSLKHLDFCMELLLKEKELDVRNIFTKFVTKNRISEDLADVLNIEFSVAEQLIDILTLTYDNKDYHLTDTRESPSPCFIQIGNEHLLMPLFGILANPFLFMLNELRRRFREDWDSAVNHREEEFRNELYKLFADERFFKLCRNINLKISGKTITDVDALIFDRETGTVGIFQLKWQDLFGASMQKRESQKKNLLHTGNLWVQRIVTWLENTEPEIIAQTFGLNKQEASKITNFNLFVLGRNSAFFSGWGQPDLRAAWGTWYQVLRLFEKSYKSKDVLGFLFNELQKDNPLKKKISDLETFKVKIGNITIFFEASDIETVRNNL